MIENVKNNSMKKKENDVNFLVSFIYIYTIVFYFNSYSFKNIILALYVQISSIKIQIFLSM